MDTVITKAFESFLNNPADLEEAILSSTRASWSGSGYSVELFHDGTYRVLWDDSIGNLYCSPGLIIGIPALAKDEYSQEDEDGEVDAGAIFEPFFDAAIERLKEIFTNDYETLQERKAGRL